MPLKQHLPPERESITHRFKVGDLKVYMTVGLFPDGRPGELFLSLKKQGALERGLANALAIMISMALQYGVPLEDIVEKMRHMRFDPQGITSNKEINFASSILDYVAQWISIRFIGAK